MHVQRNYMDVLLQNISWIEVILVLQPKVSLKTRFLTRFNNHVTQHMTHKIDECIDTA